MTIVFLLGLVVSLLSGSAPAAAATRLGLLHTQEEVWCWRQRAGLDAPGTHGLDCVPGSATQAYKTFGDVSTNSPGDWDRIVANRNAFASNPSSGRWSQPGLNNGCVDPPDTGQADWPEYPTDANTWSIRLRDAAFYALVTGSTTDHSAIKTELLWLASQGFMDFGNPSGIWCFGVLGDGDLAYWTAAVLTRVLYAYDYLGRSALTSGERDQLDQWFFAAGDYWRRDTDVGLNGVFVDRWGGNYTPTESCTGSADAYVGGPIIQNYATHYNNRKGSLVRFSTLVGLYLQEAGRNYTGGRYGTQAQLVQGGTMFVREYLMFSVFPQGVVGEFERRDTGLKDLGWAYAGPAIGEVMVMADALARTGDLSLYTYTTTAGLCGTAGTINDGGPRVGENKDLRFVLQSYMKYHTDQYARYWPSTGTEDNRIDGRDPRDGSAWGPGMHDTFPILANLYFQDAAITQAYTRQHGGAIPYAANPPEAPVSYMGEYYTFPGTLFMRGQLEGVVDPYTLTAAGDPVVTITTDCGSGGGADCSVSTTPFTTLAGTATDDVGVTQVTWACPTCTPTSGTATCATCGASATNVSWSVASIGLASGANTITVTASDGDGPPTGTDTLTVTLTTATGPVAYWPFNGTALDSATPGGHHGTLIGSPSYTTGQVGQALAFNGTSQAVSVAHAADLNITGDMSILFWTSVTVAGNTDVIMHKEPTTGNTPWFVGIVNTAQPHYQWYHHGTDASFDVVLNFTGYVIPTATPHHVAFVRDVAAETVKLYINSTLVQTLPSPPGWLDSPLGNTATVYLGQSYDGAAARFFNGTLDEVYVYNRVVTSTEIQDAWQAGLGAPVPILLRLVR